MHEEWQENKAKVLGSLLKQGQIYENEDEKEKEAENEVEEAKVDDK